MPEASLPSISVVVTGRNNAATLGRCLDALKALHYPRELLQLIYVDGGSTDESLSVLSGYANVQLLQVAAGAASPGRLRNTGLAAAQGELVQFLTATTRIDPDWLQKAAPLVRTKCAAVVGRSDQLYPERSLFHFLADLEGQNDVGQLDQLTKHLLISRSVLETLGGYDNRLHHAAELDLGARLKSAGFHVQGLRRRQCFVDEPEQGLGQYLEQGYAQGHAQAELIPKYGWGRALITMIIRAQLPLLMLATGTLPLLALLIIGWPFRHWSANQERFNLSFSQSFLYTLHRALVVYPRFVGVLRYAYVRWKSAPHRQPALGRN